MTSTSSLMMAKCLSASQMARTMEKRFYLGYSYFIGGEKLDVPHLDTPGDFREVDEPKEDEQKREQR